MLTLYYACGACSQAPHIILHEAGVHHDSIKVELPSKRTEDGRDYLAINPKGAVPALELDSGEILTENAVILQYIAQYAGDGTLLPGHGELERYRVLEWVNFITTELHKSFTPLFKPNASEETRTFFRELIAQKLDYVDRELGPGPCLRGESFTIADAYLFVILGWTGIHGIDLAQWPSLARFRERMMERASVRRVLEFEGFLQPEAAL